MMENCYDCHRTSERRSIEYHSLIAARLDVAAVRAAVRTLDRWESAGSLHPSYASRWRALLERPIDSIRDVLTANDEAARDLRQTSPFTGMIAEDERLDVLRRIW